MNHLVTMSSFGEKEFLDDTKLDSDYKNYWFDGLIGELTVEVCDWFEPARLFKKVRAGLFVYHYFIFPCVYECGAVLGRSLGDKVNLLELMLPYDPVFIKKMYPGDPKDEQSLIASVKDVSRTRMNSFFEELGRDPLSFSELIFKTTAEKVFNAIREKHGSNKVWHEKEIAFKDAYKYITAYLFEGIGFGSIYPDLTEQLFRNKYENIDRDYWENSRKDAENDGRLFPPEPTEIILEDLEKELLHILALTTYDSHYQLLGPLGLQEHRTAIRKFMNTTNVANEYPKYSSFAKRGTIRKYVEMYRCLLDK